MSHVTLPESGDPAHSQHAGQTPGPSGPRPGVSIMRGVKGTIRFLAPSLLVGMAAPFLFPALRRAARPAAKGLIKAALSLGDSIKDGAAEARERFDDLLAEVKAEREVEARASAPVNDERP